MVQEDTQQYNAGIFCGVDSMAVGGAFSYSISQLQNKIYVEKYTHNS
jgi:hypothetical protein